MSNERIVLSNGQTFISGKTFQKRLKSAAIVTEGETKKFKLLSTRLGTPQVRSTGDICYLFPVAAFRSVEDQAKAKALLLEGYKLECAKDYDGAQELYWESSNLMMSISVFADSVHRYENAFEVMATPEIVTSLSGEKSLQLQRAKPVAVEAAARTTAFDDIDFDAIKAQVDAQFAAPKALTPAQQKAAEKKAALEAKKQLEKAPF